jgi:hypothetical protein
VAALPDRGGWPNRSQRRVPTLDASDNSGCAPGGAYPGWGQKKKTRHLAGSLLELGSARSIAIAIAIAVTVE